jgi:hypothetical protein
MTKCYVCGAELLADEDGVCRVCVASGDYDTYCQDMADMPYVYTCDDDIWE